jgi:hypothetical protein
MADDFSRGVEIFHGIRGAGGVENENGQKTRNKN